MLAIVLDVSRQALRQAMRQAMRQALPLCSAFMLLTYYFAFASVLSAFFVLFLDVSFQFLTRQQVIKSLMKKAEEYPPIKWIPGVSI